MSERPATVLLVDDDPSHLKLYSWIVDRAGFRTVTALVNGASVNLPNDGFDLCLLDYRIGPLLTAREVARQLQTSFPSKPIVILSDMAWMPDDVAPFATAFVSKGEPQQIVDTLTKFLGRK